MRTLITGLDCASAELIQYQIILERRLTLPLIQELIVLYDLTQRYQRELNARAGKAMAALGQEIRLTLTHRGVQLFLNTVILENTMPDPTVDVRLEAHVRSLEQALDRAFTELAEYRALMERQLTLPLIQDLIALYHLCYHYRIEFIGERKATRALEVMGAEVLNVLARKGVVPLEVRPGQLLDRSAQCPVGVEPCSAPSEDLQIVAVQRPGFTSPEGVLAKAEVIVKRFTTAPEALLSTTGES
ncbi:hypothetical protein [Anthocerotibacter panamensis]|uniref:hypothetical protein n=1 Tax=Anthocerotibacter panamensis TaxID=2857077 RepID=UPI001C4060A2|nr:hypothetical protein [Anthocerotibacter panamensis]